MVVGWEAPKARGGRKEERERKNTPSTRGRKSEEGERGWIVEAGSSQATGHPSAVKEQTASRTRRKVARAESLRRDALSQIEIEVAWCAVGSGAEMLGVVPPASGAVENYWSETNGSLMASVGCVVERHPEHLVL